MARARGINPSIMDNEDLAELSPLTRLLFIYLWMLADREGRLEDRPKRIAAQALSYDRSADVEVMLTELVSAGFISRYSAAGVKCISILSFNRHQRPHGTEKDSRLPSETGEFSVHTRGKNGYSTGDVTLVNSLLTVNKLSDNALTPDPCLLTPDPCLLTPDANTLVDSVDDPDALVDEGVIPMPKTDAERSLGQHVVLVPPAAKTRTAKLSSFIPPDWINKAHWDAWHSCAKRKNATHEQRQMAVDKLSAWRDAKLNFAGALENAAIGGYQGLFIPSTGSGRPAQQQRPSRHSGFNDIDYEEGINADGTFN